MKALLIFFLAFFFFSCRNAARADSDGGPDANRSGPAAGVAVSIYVSLSMCPPLHMCPHTSIVREGPMQIARATAFLFKNFFLHTLQKIRQ